MGRDIHYCECGEEIHDDMETCRKCEKNSEGKIMNCPKCQRPMTSAAEKNRETESGLVPAPKIMSIEFCAIAQKALDDLLWLNAGGKPVSRDATKKIILSAILKAVKTMPDPYTENQAFLDWYEEIRSG